MTALFNWRFWGTLGLVVGLAFSHFTAYRAGKANVRAEWTAEKLAQSEAARQREKALTIATQKVDHALQVQKARLIAERRAADDSLRLFQATLNAPDSPAATASRANGTGGLERELLGECANNLAALAQTADRLEGKVIGLQSYVKSVCWSPQ